VKTFASAAGFDDAAFAALAGLSEIEAFSSNGMDASDEAIRVLGGLKSCAASRFSIPANDSPASGSRRWRTSRISNACSAPVKSADPLDEIVAMYGQGRD